MPAKLAVPSRAIVQTGVFLSCQAQLTSTLKMSNRCPQSRRRLEEDIKGSHFLSSNCNLKKKKKLTETVEVKVISGRTRKNIRIARKASQNSCLNTKHLQVDLAHPGVGFVFFCIVQLFSNTCTNMVAWGGFITLWGCVAASGTGSIWQVDQRLDAIVFKQIMEAIRKFKRGGLLKMDHDPEHTTKSMLDALKSAECFCYGPDSLLGILCTDLKRWPENRSFKGNGYYQTSFGDRLIFHLKIGPRQPKRFRWFYLWWNWCLISILQAAWSLTTWKNPLLTLWPATSQRSRHSCSLSWSTSPCPWAPLLSFALILELTW